MNCVKLGIAVNAHVRHHWGIPSNHVLRKAQYPDVIGVDFAVQIAYSLLRALPKLHSPSLNGEAEVESMWRHLLFLLSVWTSLAAGKSGISTTSPPLHYSTCVDCTSLVTHALV